MVEASSAVVRRLATSALGPRLEREVRNLLERTFAGTDEGDFTDEDWRHSIGGMHFLIGHLGSLAGHASVVERRLEVGGRPVRTGYVEAVAIAPALQRRGLGTRLMHNVNDWIRERYELGALGTGSVSFYERLGWRPWPGPTGVRAPGGLQLTPDEDGYILVLFTPTSPPLPPTAVITCEWRPGESW